MLFQFLNNSFSISVHKIRTTRIHRSSHEVLSTSLMAITGKTTCFKHSFFFRWRFEEWYGLQQATAHREIIDEIANNYYLQCSFQRGEWLITFIFLLSLYYIYAYCISARAFLFCEMLHFADLLRFPAKRKQCGWMNKTCMHKTQQGAHSTFQLSVLRSAQKQSTPRNKLANSSRKIR